MSIQWSIFGTCKPTSTQADSLPSFRNDLYFLLTKTQSNNGNQINIFQSRFKCFSSYCAMLQWFIYTQMTGEDFLARLDEFMRSEVLKNADKCSPNIILLLACILF